MDVESLRQVVALVAAVLAVATGVWQLYKEQGKDAGPSRAKQLIQSSNLSKEAKDELGGIVGQQRRLVFYLAGLVTFLGVVAGLLSLTVARSTLDGSLLSLLKQYDPAVFATSNSDIHFARTLHNRESLLANSSLGAVLGSTTKTFDMIAFNGYTVVESSRNAIEDAMKRGVRCRFIFLDPRETNAAAFAVMSQHVGEEQDALTKNAKYGLRGLIEIQARARSNPTVYPGQLEVRWLAGPMMYSGWIRDRNTTAAQIQIGLYPYRPSADWSYFKAGRSAGPMLDLFAAEYEMLWVRATEWTGT